MWFVNWLLSDLGQTVIAGGLGGVVRWLALKEAFRQGLSSVAIGSICSIYLGPVATPLLSPVVGRLLADPASQVGLGGFLIGTGGVAVVGFIIDLWRTRRRNGNDDRK